MLQGQRNFQARIYNRINTSRFPTLREVWGHASTKNIWILAPKVSFPRFLSHSDRILTDRPNRFPDFNLESLKSFTKNIFILKNLTDFRMLAEIGMDSQLALLVILDLMRFCIHLTLFISCIIE